MISLVLSCRYFVVIAAVPTQFEVGRQCKGIIVFHRCNLLQPIGAK